MNIIRVEVSGSCVRVQSVTCLVVARFILRVVSSGTNRESIKQQTYQSSQVVPDLGYVWVQSDRTGVRIKRISVLVDLVVEHSN